MRQVMVYNGGAVGLEPFPTGVGGGLNYIHQATRNLNHAEITTLPTVPVEVIATPGANKVILPIMGFAVSAITVIYENITVGYSTLDLTWAGASGNGPNQAVVKTSVLLASGASTSILGTLLPGPSVGGGDYTGSIVANEIAVAGAADKALQVLAYNDDGNYTEGHVNNTLRISVAFVVFDVISGLLVAA